MDIQRKNSDGVGAATKFNSIGIFLRPPCNAEEVVPTIALRDIFPAFPELHVKIYRRGELHRHQCEFSCNESLANER